MRTESSYIAPRGTTIRRPYSVPIPRVPRVPTPNVSRAPSGAGFRAPSVRSGNLLSILPPEFTRQLNPAGIRLMEQTPYRETPGETSYSIPWQGVLMAQNAPASTIVHEAMHPIFSGLNRPVSSPETLRDVIPATEFYTASRWYREPEHTLRLALSPSMRRDEVLAAAAQRTNILGQPLSGIGTYGFTSRMRQPLLRYFSPTALGLAGGRRSTREVRMMTGRR